MKLKYKIIFFLLPFMLYMGDCDFSCKSSLGPDPPDPPDQIEYYDYTVTYQRTAIYKPENPDPTQIVLAVNGGTRFVSITKLNDYTFTAEVDRLPTHVRADEVSHAIYAVDQKRFEEEFVVGIYVYGRPHAVGDIFILKCKQNGTEKRLMKIVPNPYFPSLPAKCEPQMVQFRIKKGGVVVDE